MDADLIGSDSQARTIDHIEVKSSVNGTPGWTQRQQTTRFMNWINEAVTGTIAGNEYLPPSRRTPSRSRVFSTKVTAVE